MDTDIIIYCGKQLLDKVETFISLVEDNNLTNEQWFINFEDKLNELSIKH